MYITTKELKNMLGAMNFSTIENILNKHNITDFTSIDNENYIKLSMVEINTLKKEVEVIEKPFEITTARLKKMFGGKVKDIICRSEFDKNHTGKQSHKVETLILTRDDLFKIYCYVKLKKYVEHDTLINRALFDEFMEFWE